MMLPGIRSGRGLERHCHRNDCWGEILISLVKALGETQRNILEVEVSGSRDPGSVAVVEWPVLVMSSKSRPIEVRGYKLVST